MMSHTGIPLGPKPKNSHSKSFCVQLSESCQELDIILENTVVLKLKLSKNVNNKKSASNILQWKKILERFG